MMPRLSCIIIGCNPGAALGKVLKSINQQINVSDNIEIVYVDDGSSDGSYNYFKEFPLNYATNSCLIKKTSGRAFARNRGAEISRGEWLLFINSSTVLHRRVFSSYLAVILHQSAVAFAGTIKYASNDLVFTQYLNNKTRGTNKYKNNAVVEYKNLLFGNALIRADIFDNIKFAVHFTGYGGAELDFSYRLQKQYPNMIRFCKPAIVYRNNHPSYGQHCNRLIGFGKENFNLLCPFLQKEVIKCPFFLVRFPGGFYLMCLLLVFAKTLYNKFGFFFGLFIVRLGLWSSILVGFYKSK